MKLKQCEEREEKVTGLEQSQHHELRQTLSPQQLQYISLLQMNMAELNERINELETENPLIEVTPPQRVEPQVGDIAKWVMSSAVIRSDDDPDDYGQKKGREAAQYDDADICEYLRSQFDFSLNQEQTRLLERLINSMDENGYLPITAQRVSKELGVDEQLADEAISYLKTLDPPGICAFDLTESLCIQLKRRGIFEECAEKLICEQLEQLSRGHFQKAAAEAGCTVNHAREIFEAIKKLSPKPAASFGSHQRAYIVPDVTVEQLENGALACRYNDNSCAHLNINKSYLRLADADGETKEYVENKLSQAMWMVKAVQSRRETIEKTAQVIVRRQQGFFIDNESLVPMQLKDVAKEVGVHESTISRCVNGKYIECKRGVFPMRKFFSQAISAATGAAGSDEAKERIRSIIEGESPPIRYLIRR